MAITSVLIAGCGGSLDPRRQVRAAVTAYQTAAAKRDAGRTCAVMTASFWHAQIAQVSADDRQLGLPSSACAAAFGYLYRLGARPSSALGAARVEDISVHGDHATAALVNRVERQPLQLVRTDGRWQLACCTGSQLEHRASATYRVPSGSMEPTLKLGQVVASNNVIFRTQAPRLGEIIVFHPPRGANSVSGPACGDPAQGAGHGAACDRPTPQVSTQLFLKRIVGLPGDRISIVDGDVIRNGVKETASYAAPCSVASLCDFRSTITIPPGEYFVLGDNRGDSEDSRFWGPIKRGWIVGLIVHR